MIYGRYVEIVVPPLLAIALVQLAGLNWRALSMLKVAAATAISTVVVVALRLGAHPPRPPSRWNVASLPFFTFDLGWISLVGAGVVAAVVAVALIALGRRAPLALAPVVLILFLPTTAVVEHNPVLNGQRSVYPSGWTSPGTTLGHAPRVAYDMTHYDVIARYEYQWFLPHTQYLLFSSATAPPPVRYVISSREWARKHPELRPQDLWDDPGRDQSLFRIAPRR